VDPGGSLALTLSQKGGLNPCCDFSFAVFMGVGEGNNLVFLSIALPTETNPTCFQAPGTRQTQGKLKKAGTIS